MTTRLPRALIAVGLSSVALVAAQAAPASAATRTFEGTCAIVGVAEVAKPVAPLLPSPNSVVFHGRGTCSGRLDGHRLPQGGAPVDLISFGDKLTGCTATVVPSLSVLLRFYLEGRPRTKDLRGTAQVTFAGRSMTSVLRGATSGLASATGTIQGGPEVLEDCAAGRLKRIGISMDVLTASPLVSEDHPAPEVRPSREPAAQRLRLAVRPRQVRAGRRTRLRFVATSLQAGRGRPVRGARIRVAGRSVRTDRRGRASLVLHLRRLGSRRVTASAPGGATAVGTFRVVRSR